MRIYSAEAELGKKIKLTKDQQRHIKVRRLRPEEPICAFDGKGREYRSKYASKVRDQLVLEEEIKPRKEAQNGIALAIAPVKGYRMDFLVEKTTELGISKIMPIICEHSIVKPSKGKIERWRKIAIEACCQSGRATLPTITEPIPFVKATEKVRDYDHAYICDIGGKEEEMAGKTILIFIGPEGGFSENELKIADKKEIQRIKLTNTILRTETAGIAALVKAANMRNI